MWPILANIVEPQVHLRDKMTYLTLMNRVHNVKIEDEKQLKGFIEKIQDLISSPVTRHEGLLFLDALQDQNREIYIPNWGNIVLGSLKCPDFYISRDLTLRILSRNVRNFGAKPEYSLFFDKCIPSILALLLQAQDKDVLGVCETLAACMNFIPDIVAPHGGEIEKFLIRNMDCASTETVAAIAHCFALLPLAFVKGELTKGRYQSAWHNICSKTLVTLQSLLNEILLFPGVETSLVNVDNLPKLEIPSKGQEFCELLSQIRIFKSLCHCLAQLLSTQTNGYSMQVPINDILKCLQRVFNITEISKVPKAAQKLEVFRIGYPLLQHAAFLLFEAAIVNYNIIDQSGNFVKILLRSLEIIEITSFAQNSISQIRVTTWKLLNVWLNEYGAKGAYSIATDPSLLAEILKDIDRLDDVRTKSKSISHDKTNQVSSPTLACIEASKALKNTLLYGGSFVNKELLEKLFVASLKVIRRIQICWNTHECFPDIYASEKCRKRLYDLMQTFCVYLEPLQTKYVVQSLNIFKLGLKDPSIKVKEVCHRAYKLCRLFIHPKKTPPEATLPLQSAVNSVPAPVASLAVHWNNSPLWNINGHTVAANFNQEPRLPVPCPAEQTFTETVEDAREEVIIPDERESPSYSDDGDSGGNYNRTLSKNSSQSEEDEESELECMDDDKSYSEDVEPELVAEPSYAPIMTVPQRGPHINSLDERHSVVEREKNGTEMEVSSEEILPEVNSCENTEMVDPNPEDGLGDGAIPERIPENGVRRGEVDTHSEEDESGEEEEDEEDEDEENIAGVYVMARKRSQECYDDKVVKRQRVVQEEEEVVEEEVEEQSSDGEMNNNNEHLSEEEKVPEKQNATENQNLCNQEVVNKEEKEDETEAANSTTEDASPSLKEMCRDFVLAEPAEIS